MGDGISDGHRMTEDDALEKLYLLHVLELLFMRQPTPSRFHQAFDAIEGNRTHYGRNATLDADDLARAKELAESLFWNPRGRGEISGTPEREIRWAKFTWDLIEAELFCREALGLAIKEISLLPFDELLAYGLARNRQGKLELDSDNEKIFKTQLFGIKDQLEQWDPTKQRFLLGHTGEGKRIYFF